MVTTGQKAPDFIAPALHGGEGAMFQLFTEVQQHKAVVLVFAPADFVPTCTAELCAVRDAGWEGHPELAVIALTGDSLFSHAAYADQCEFDFRLVSDFHSSIAESYDLGLEEWEGHSAIPARATVVIDSDWVVQDVVSADPLSETSPAPVERAAETLHSMGFEVVRPEVAYGKP